MNIYYEICWACGNSGIVRADGIAINCPECNPVEVEDVENNPNGT